MGSKKSLTSFEKSFLTKLNKKRSEIGSWPYLNPQKPLKVGNKPEKQGKKSKARKPGTILPKKDKSPQLNKIKNKEKTLLEESLCYKKF